ncbi:MAG: rhodanese-related sulfurtransferase [Chroococcidiopsidaceae cyanobacterium CP_BM_RX_35]|nr:rhodanese-related sulfurtransferase [Chroococcidiopsidaceae cyanobacterium CP_BM_RX_35]
MSAQFFSQPIPQSSALSGSSGALPQAQISVEELAQRLQTGDSKELQLLDVREPEEVVIAQLAGFENLPLSQFADWATAITTRFNPETETLALCHHGIRSAQMCQWLRTQGFKNVKNIAGGIDAYSVQVDPTIPRY